MAALPCETEHENEVFAVFDIDRDAFPGDDTLVDETEETCIMLLGSYTGVPFDDSDLSVWAFVPRADGWSLGEREARCVLYDSDLSKLTRSQKATDAGSSP